MLTHGAVRLIALPAMPTYDAIADMPLTIESYALEERSRQTASFERVTVTVALTGAGETGLGEDVNYDAGDQRAALAAGPVLPLAGEWTLESFSRHLAGLDLFGGREPAYAVGPEYRRWAYESAAADLALRQAGRSLAQVLGREARPLRFGVSLRLGDPPSAEPVLRRLEAYPGIGFKLDAEPTWTPELIERLAGTGAVDVVDFKGKYRGTPVDVDTDPELYRRCAEAFPDAWLEDPDLDDAGARAALEPHLDRVTWDAPIHGVADVDALADAPRCLNVKPSRFGSWRELLAFYDMCEQRGIACYGGGQSELGVGRGQIQLLAALFHPDGANDVAPAGFDWDEFPSGLPASPLDPAPAPTGFRRQ